jgi:hypothetical protein
MVHIVCCLTYQLYMYHWLSPIAASCHVTMHIASHIHVFLGKYPAYTSLKWKLFITVYGMLCWTWRIPMYILDR